MHLFPRWPCSICTAPALCLTHILNVLCNPVTMQYERQTCNQSVRCCRNAGSSSWTLLNNSSDQNIVKQVTSEQIRLLYTCAIHADSIVTDAMFTLRSAITHRASTEQRCCILFTDAVLHTFKLTHIAACPSGLYMQGASFETITAMTDKFEGCVVREMRRLAELMKNLHLAAKVRHSPHVVSPVCMLSRLALSLIASVSDRIMRAEAGAWPPAGHW